MGLYFSNEMIATNKKGFAVPIDNWLKNELKRVNSKDVDTKTISTIRCVADQVLLEKQKNRAEYLADRADKKAILFDMMIDYAEKEFNIPIRKKQEPK